MKVRVLAGLVAVAMLVGVGSASAQNLGAGVKIGPGYSSLSGNPSVFGDHIKKDRKLGLTAGVFFTVPATELLAFQPEVLFQQIGTKWEDLDFVDADGHKFTRKVSELEIPLLLRVGRRAEDRSFYLLVGPTIGFITKAEQTDEFADTTTDIKDTLKSATVSVAIGLGMTFNKFLVEFRYTGQVNDVNKTEDPVHGKNKNSQSAILVGYQFK